MKSDLVDIEVFIHAETEKAMLVSGVEAGGENQAWIPLSQIEISNRDGRSAEITLPRWMAEERKLV